MIFDNRAVQTAIFSRMVGFVHY